MNQPARKPEELFREILLFIEESNATLNAGGDVSLPGLETKVAELCRQVQALTPSQAQTHKARLELLFKELSALEARMRASYNELKGQIENLGMRQKAAVAYSTIEAISKPKKSD